MTNEQWSNLTHQLKLPDAARMPIEEELDLFQRRAMLVEFAAAEPDPRPSDVKQEFVRGASLAGELLDILESLKSTAYHALVDPAISEACLAIAEQREALWGNSSTMLLKPLLECPERQNLAMSQHHAHLTALYDRFTVAAKTFAIKGKPGKNPDRTRELINRVSKIVETHSGKPLSKGKRQTDFAHKFCKLADPRIGPGSIKLALENLESESSATSSVNSG